MITDASLAGQDTEKHWAEIVQKLKLKTMGRNRYSNAQNEIVEEQGDWEYEAEPYEDNLFNVLFYEPYHMQPSLYHHIGIVNTIYKYRLLYEIHVAD